MASAAAAMISSEKGKTFYEEGAETYNLYYDKVPGVNWVIMIKMPQSELEEPIVSLNSKLMKLSAAALVCCIIAVLIQVAAIASGLKRVKKFAGSLAEEDFTIKPLKYRSVDELGQMSSSLNNMFESNKEVIERISVHAGDINGASARLNTVSRDLQGLSWIKSFPSPHLRQRNEAEVMRDERMSAMKAALDIPLSKKFIIGFN